MKNHESLPVKLIKRFYGISEVLDEYKRAQIDRIGNNAFMFLFSYMVIANFIAAFFVGKEPEKTLWVLLGFNLLFTAIFIGGYIIRATSKLELTKNEVEPQDIAKEMKKIKRIGIFMGIYFAGVYYFLNALLSVMLNEGSFFTSIVEKGNIIGSVVSGVLFGGAMYLLSKSRLKKVEDL